VTDTNYLGHYLGLLDWSAERLADEINKVRGAGTISAKAPYAWLRGGQPRSLATTVAQVISENLGYAVTPAAIWPSRAAGEGPRARFLVTEAAEMELRRELIEAAHESSQHAGMATSRGVDEESIEQVHEDIAQAARDYARLSPLNSYREAKRIWNQARLILDRTGRPGQTSDTYLALGQACGLLAMASFDLGSKDAAGAQARSAWMYGRHIGHTSLSAWARGTQALIDYWSGRFDGAVNKVGHALAVAPPGTATVRLRAVQARAFSHLQAPVQAAEAAAAARQELEAARPDDELHDHIGGEFSFDQARLARCLATAYVHLRQPKEALVEAQLAADLYGALADGQSWPAVEAEAQTELAAAHLLHRDAESAAELLAAVMTLAHDFRTEGVRQRLVAVRALLAQGGISGRAASRLRTQIDEFVEAAPTQLMLTK
jgi:hypothetical protein